MKTINLLFTTILSSLFAADAAAQCSVFCHNADLSNISDMRGLSLNDVHRNMSMHMRTSAATASRIIAQADLSNNGASFVYTDSIKLSYVGTHGGDLNHLGLQLKFDSGYVYAYNSGTSSWDLNLY